MNQEYPTPAVSRAKPQWPWGQGTGRTTPAFSGGANAVPPAHTVPSVMAKRHLVTYLHISLVDLFTYFYPPSPTTSQAGTMARGGPEVSVPPRPTLPTQRKVWCSSPSGGRGQGPAAQPQGGWSSTPPAASGGGAGLWKARGERGSVQAQPSPGAWDPAPTGNNSGPGGHLAPLKLAEWG